MKFKEIFFKKTWKRACKIWKKY